MTIVKQPDEMQTLIGRKLGPTDWLEVSQQRIDDFARCTRAKSSRQGHAQNWLVASMVAEFVPRFFQVAKLKRSINYGTNRLRFGKLVPAGARIRATCTPTSLQGKAGGMELISEIRIELEGSEEPALVVEQIRLLYAE